MKTLESLLEEAASFIQSEFNLELQQSQLKIYSFENWQEFCEVNGFDVNSEGLYVPISYSAYVRVDSPVLVSNIFHEYFGHGLFVEHSVIGKRLVEIIQSHGDERSFLYREVNPREQFFGLCRTNICNYEGFAVWLEALLCEETGNRKVWQLKKDRLPKDHVSLFEFFQDAETKLTRFGFMAQLGFPKFYDDNKVLGVIKKLYGSAFNNIDFIILYGSQKPESDIDLFIVSTNRSMNFFNGWLDIYELNRGEFHYQLYNLDISVTDPLFTGRVIYGDHNLVEELKRLILKLGINNEKINYNLAEARRQYELHNKLSDPRLRRIAGSYAKSFYYNAISLIQGFKPLTLQKIGELYDLSRPIESLILVEK
ncbi:hypothetical protein J7K74_00095 [Candidatus Woesearchaeota archaeon]|nr:hypothetical protein [Candidatus Woesearchaeota archaeon]